VALVILDLGLPDLDGIEVLRRVHREGTRLPVIVLTARNDAEDRIRELGLPIAGFVTKPFAFAHLAECVRAGIVNGRET
jgi:DNA-binding response OmpR family regulator